MSSRSARINAEKRLKRGGKKDPITTFIGSHDNPLHRQSLASEKKVSCCQPIHLQNQPVLFSPPSPVEEDGDCERVFLVHLSSSSELEPPEDQLQEDDMLFE